MGGAAETYLERIALELKAYNSQLLLGLIIEEGKPITLSEIEEKVRNENYPKRGLLRYFKFNYPNSNDSWKEFLKDDLHLLEITELIEKEVREENGKLERIYKPAPFGEMVYKTHCEFVDIEIKKIKKELKKEGINLPLKAAPTQLIYSRRFEFEYEI